VHARRTTLLWLAGILLATLVAYAPALRCGFAFDAGRIASPVNLEGRPNGMVAELRPVAEYWSVNYWWGDDHQVSMLFRPLSVFSFALTNHLLGGLDADRDLLASAHHLGNVVLHLLATLLAFALLRPFARTPGPVLAATAVFALHALRSEPAIDLTSRTETLAFVLGASFVLAVLAAAARRGLAALALGGVAALLLFLALSAKESALAWVALAPLYAFATRGLRRREALLLIAAAAPAVAVWAWLRARALEPAGGVLDVSFLFNPLYYEHDGPRLLSAVRIWGYGLWLVGAPFRLVCDYGHATFEVVRSPLDPGLLLAAAALVGGLLVSIAAARRAPPLMLAGAFFFGFSFITTNIPLRIGTIFAERLYYTPAFALSWVVLWLGARAGRWRPAFALAVAAWSAACAWTIVQRARVWRDNDTLFAHDARVQPRCATLRRHVARLKIDRGDLDGAAADLREIVALDPEFPEALADLGTIVGIRGDHAGAEQYYGRALATPEYRRGTRSLIVANLMSVLESQGKRAEAARWAAYQRGLAALERADPESAERELRAARADLPDNLRLRIELAAVLARREHRAEARAEYEALLADPALDRFTRERLEGRLRGLR
jgi:Flp pilus assembly protein TadD